MVKRYIITTAQYNAGINKNFLKNIKKYASVNKAEIIILPTIGRSITEDEKLHRDLEQYEIIDTDHKLNNNLKIKNFGVRPQQINPLTGLERYAQGDKSYITPGTKQVLKYVANSYDDIPKAILTTGAITTPYYNLRHAIGVRAEKDHEYGFVYVETKGTKYFHFHQVKALVNGTFADHTGLYKNGKRHRAPEAVAMVVGDLHPGDTDPRHEKCTFDQIKQLGGKLDIFLHDTFNGKSISHHYKNHYIRKYEVYNEQGLNLTQELKDTLKAINKYAKHTKGTVYIVASNHDEHLYRYLDEGRFIGDKGNDLIGSMLYTAALKGENPLEFGLKFMGKLEPNVVFIERGEGHKMLGYELGNHGDEGANGGRGSPRSVETANSKSITAHRHSAMKIRNTYGVGTSTYPRLDYNKVGYSNWSQTNAILYKIGTVQLINTIKGLWKW